MFKIKNTFIVLTMLFLLLLNRNNISNSQNVSYNVIIFTTIVTESPKSTQDSLIDFAKKFIGLPYKYGGIDPKGFDCSGYIKYIYKNFGYDIPRALTELSKIGEKVNLKDSKKGDLLFFKNRQENKLGHVSMVIYNNNVDTLLMIHSVNRGITIDNLHKMSYYSKRYLSAKHLGFF